MGKNSFLDRIRGKKGSKQAVTVDEELEQDHQEIEGEVDHLWMKEDLDAKKPKLEKDPRVDTGILRNRIADKIAKMNSH